MSRLLYIIKKELFDMKANLAFHIIVVVVPLVYLAFWVLSVSQDISFPVSVQNGQVDTGFAEYLFNYSTPDGVRYFYLDNNNMAVISITEPITSYNGLIVGGIELNLSSIDLNMVKNYHNRLSGAINSYLEKYYLGQQAISIKEYKTNKTDTVWAHYFTASLMALGILMAGLLFGALSMTSEWTSGTVVFLFTSPQNPGWILAGKEIAFLLKGFLASIIFLVVAKIITPEISIAFGGLFATIFLGYWLIGLLGLIIGILVKEPIVNFLFTLLASVALWILGNGFGGMEFLLGNFGKTIVLLNPIAYLLSLLQYFINGVATDWVFNMLVLLGSIIILQIFGYLLYKHKIYLSSLQK